MKLYLAEHFIQKSDNSKYCNFLNKSMDWFLYDNGLRHERVKKLLDLDLKNLRLSFLTS